MYYNLYSTIFYFTFIPFYLFCNIDNICDNDIEFDANDINDEAINEISNLGRQLDEA